MRTETHAVQVEQFTESVDAQGLPVYTPTGETVTITITDIYADEGKLLRRIGGVGGCTHITLGTADSADNYEEVDE